MFEQNISEQEKKRQLLTFLSKGISLPDYLIEKEYASENQVKTIKYLQLDNLYKDYSVSEKEIKKTYEENKKFLIQDFKEINYVELLPNNLTGQKEYNKSYFKKIDEIENNILDNMKMSDILKEYNLSPKVIKKVNIQRKDKTGKEIVEVNKELFTEIFNSKNINEPKLTNLNNKFYLSVILSVEKISRSLEDKEIKETIISQLKLKHIIDSNTKIIKEMSKGNFKKEQFQNFSKDKKLEIKNAIIKNIKDEIIFKSDMIKEIFKMNDGEFQLITNSLLTQNYIIYSEKTEELAFDKNNKDYEQYKARAKLNIANQIYTDYDKTVNNKYDVKINEKVLNRIKNTL